MKTQAESTFRINEKEKHLISDMKTQEKENKWYCGTVAGMIIYFPPKPKIELRSEIRLLIFSAGQASPLKTECNTLFHYLPIRKSDRKS